MDHKGAAWVLSGHELELGKLSRTHIISVTWVLYRKPVRADHMGPIGDMSRQNGHGVEVGKAFSMGSIRDISGQNGNGVELGDIIWDPYCFSNMGPT